MLMFESMNQGRHQIQITHRAAATIIRTVNESKALPVQIGWSCVRVWVQSL